MDGGPAGWLQPAESGKPDDLGAGGNGRRACRHDAEGRFSAVAWCWEIGGSRSLLLGRLNPLRAEYQRGQQLKVGLLGGLYRVPDGVEVSPQLVAVTEAERDKHLSGDQHGSV